MRTKCSTSFTLDRRLDKDGQPILKNLPINMDFTFSGKRLRYYTGYRIDADKWLDVKETDPQTGEIFHIQQVKRGARNKKGETASEINKRLLLLKSLITKIFVESAILYDEVSVDYLRDVLRATLHEKLTSGKRQGTDVMSVYKRYAQEAEVSPGRRKLIVTALNHTGRFVHSQGRRLIYFDEITPSWVESFWRYLLGDDYLNDEYKNLKAPLRPRKKCRNTAISIMRGFKAFVNWASLPQNGALMKGNPFSSFSIPSEQYGRPVYITKEERDHLMYAPMPSKSLERTRDIFVFQCLTGCRIGDLIHLTKDNIKDGAIEYIPVKTRSQRPEVVRVPLSEKAREILSRYSLPGDAILPFISNQLYNVHIKEVFQAAGLNRLVTRLNPLTQEEEQVPLSQIATSHMARRTFVGILHKQNIKNEVIASMSGHSKTSKAFSRYYDIDSETQDNVIKNYLD